MANVVPARFKRVADAFDEAAVTLRARPPCGSSSGSEHSAAAAESFTDLSGLVNSFMEKSLWEGIEVGAGGDDVDRDEVEPEDDVDETKDDLERLLSYGGGDDDTKRNVFEKVEKSIRESGDRSAPEFKRRLMARLRFNGFDAGVCKTRWEKNGGCPRGDYEYIDVNVNGGRYIVEVFLRGEFEIVRPTASYTCLLESFPAVYVGTEKELKKIARIMSSAMRKSMKKMGIHVPPWRRLAYMQAKWFSSYKRTTNEIASVQAAAVAAPPSSLYKHRRSVGFGPTPEMSFKCREDFGVKNGFRIGNLAAALSGN
ncbi:PREDICTED: uncharacterized protein LOC109167236 [Ipomoea nil]|uniref:uncharacterized protein LOC109167236 n=1 Tax=Ipomoea nil TaxID=35883 RepID=UPI0009012111|nr:PREDICTED: uncharacterized protein LOC109167236 [Ipomoea nil]